MSWRTVGAQTIRAFACSLGPMAFAGSLLASATTTTIRGLHAIMRASQDPFGGPLRAAQVTTADAGNAHQPRNLCVLRRPPSDVLLESADFRTERSDLIEEIPVWRSEAPKSRRGVPDLRPFGLQAGTRRANSRTRPGSGTVSSLTTSPAGRPGRGLGARRCRTRREMSSECVDRPGSLADQKIARAEKHALTLLFRRLHLDEAHGRT